MRKTFLLVPLLALGLAACGQSDKTAAPADAASSAAAPVAAPTPFATVSAEDGAKVAHERHDGFEAMGKAMKAVGDGLKSGHVDMAVVKASAAKIKETAPKIAGWFPVGSGVAVAPKSAALPAIWEKPGEFQQAAAKLVDQAGKFDAMAQAGDPAAVGAAMKELGGACKGCHDQFKKKDD
ncbi:MAG: cytochrome c [Sphingomonadales bacterium]|nr:cytochrome c [Sphingomonadales bacterium]